MTRPMRPVWRMPAAFLVFAVALAFFVRVWFAYASVLGGSFVRFAENDPWYHMRLVENLLANFPHQLAYDPYLLFGGQNVGVAPLFDLIIAAGSLVLGLGAPSPWLVERVGAYAPAVLGAACVLPVYGLGKTLFATRAGLFAAGLAAILPGQFLARSSLGFTDHHVTEVLLAACTLLFLARACDLRSEHSTGWRRTQAAIGGLFLGSYLINWAGGALLVVVIASASVVALGVDRDAQTPTRIASILGIAFAVAALVVAPFVGSWFAATSHLAVLIGAGTSTLIAAAAAAVLDRSARPRWWLLPLAVPTAVVVVLIGERLAPESARLIYGYLARLGADAGPRVGEALPLFSALTPAPLLMFFEFGVSIYLAVAAAVLLARTADAGKLLVLAMFVAAFALTVNQVRFSYYLAVPAAVLAGWACDRMLTLAGRRQEIVFLALVLVVFVPNAQLARLYAESSTGPSDDWYEALTWLRMNSPEPLDDPQAFDLDYAGMSERQPYSFPASAYAVTAAWDRGYWITRIARRMPSANPTQVGAGRVAAVFLAPDEQSGVTALDRLRARYLIVDTAWLPRLTPRRDVVVGGLPDAIATQGLNPNDYYQVYERRAADGSTEPVLLFYPRYYQALAIRLAAFDGRAVRPASVSVAVFHPEPAASGVRLILDELKAFPSAAAADDFVRAAPDSRRLVGTNPFESCVSLDAITTLIPVHRSSPAGTVRIFQRRDF